MEYSRPTSAYPQITIKLSQILEHIIDMADYSVARSHMRPDQIVVSHSVAFAPTPLAILIYRSI